MSVKNNVKLVRVKDFEMMVYPYKEYISEELRLRGGYEKDYIEIILKRIKEGDTVLDIGANIGLHTLHFSRAVGSSGKVFSFEPDPANLRLLRFNVRRNKCKNVTIFPFALGASNHSRKLYLCKSNKGGQGFTDLYKLNDPIIVKVRRAVDILGNENPVVAKIDVEGAEPMVFRGFGSIRPVAIFFEFIPEQLLALNHNPLGFLNLLNREGYRLFMVHGKEVSPMKAKEITRLALLTDEDLNLLAELEK